MSEPVEYRCYCSRQPLLGVIDKDKNGKWFVHIKVFKQSKVFGEIVATEGDLSVRCRECLRWHHLHIAHKPPPGVETDGVFSEEGDLPPELSEVI